MKASKFSVISFILLLLENTIHKISLRGIIGHSGSKMKAFAFISCAVMLYCANSSFAAINSYEDIASFSAVSGPLITTNFDNFATGTAFMQPSFFDGVSYSFSSTHNLPTNFRTFNSPYDSISGPNVLAAAKQFDGTLETGITTLYFPFFTNAAGLYLIMGNGLNSSFFATSDIVVEDFEGNSFTTYVTFQGQVGEQRFIGFDSPLGIRSITFSSAYSINGFGAIAMDNVSYAFFPPDPGCTDGGCDQDSDGDGYSAGRDCNDHDPSVHPFAPELCDGKDNNCDGQLGIGEIDLDGDGYMLCQNDCNDSDPKINPSGFEIPGNAIDENCDGSLGTCNPNAEWKNHAQFVRCVAHETDALIEQGYLTQEEGDVLINSAAQSNIGKN